MTGGKGQFVFPMQDIFLRCDRVENSEDLVFKPNYGIEFFQEMEVIIGLSPSTCFCDAVCFNV